jgi:multiple sugar transport system permease protein
VTGTLLRKRGGRLVIYGGAALLVAWALVPILWVFISSISVRSELYSVPIKHWIPEAPTLQNFIDLFTSGPKYRGQAVLPGTELLALGMRNSLFLALGSATIVTIVGLLAGYAFSRLRFRGKRLLFILLMVLVPLPIWVSLTSLYFFLQQVGLRDSLFGLLLVFVAYQLPLATWLMQTYIDRVPKEIEESAVVDGASRLRALVAVVAPIARPGISAVFLVTFLTTWNNFLIPAIFSTSSASAPMTVVLSLFIGQYEVAWESMAAAALLTMLPPAILALFFQRYLVRGLALGAVD